MSVFQMPKSGKCQCQQTPCKCPKTWAYHFRFQGKQYTRRAPSEKEARKLEKAYLQQLNSARSASILAFLDSDASRMRRVSARIGSLMDAYAEAWPRWLKKEAIARRNLNDLALVIAYALDMWTPNPGGRQGTKKGAPIPDLERIRALSAGRLNRELIYAYYLAKQIEAGIATTDGNGKPVIVWREAPSTTASTALSTTPAMSSALPPESTPSPNTSCPISPSSSRPSH